MTRDLSVASKVVEGHELGGGENCGIGVGLARIRTASRHFRGSRSEVRVRGSWARVQVHGFGGPVGARRAPIMNPSTGVSIMTSLCRVKMNRALKRGGRDTLDLEAQTPQVLTGAVHNLCVCRVINITQ